MMAVTKQILLVDDDDELRQSLASQLMLHEDFSVIEAASGAEGLEKARATQVDMILLDINMPDIDGREVCRLMRRANINVPIIMLTALESDADTILGLDSGANDYVVKPFRFGVLLARIRAHLRQHEQSEDAVFTIGGYCFRPGAKLLVDQQRDIRVRLTEKETAILKFLYRAGDTVTGRDVLLNEVWGYNAGVSTHTLETHIYRLRQKIEPDPTHARILVTETGGYRLVV